MTIFDLIILGLIIFIALVFIILYLVRPFRKNEDPCVNCPYSGACSKK